MTKTFAAQIQGFADLTKRNLKYVAVESIQDVVEAAQTPQPSVKRTGGTFQEGKIPVDTSELINSLISGSNGSFGPEGADSYAVALAGYELGDYMRFGWTAPHAMRMEAGFTGTDAIGRTYNQPGRHFVGANAARFSEFVMKHALEVRK